MDYSTPWTPSLNGNTLNACALLRDLAENDERPSFRRAEEKPWTAGAIGPELERAREARDGILESVLMIWRLNMTQEHGDEDQDWQNHLTAWLVRSDCLLRDSGAYLANPRFVTATFADPSGSHHFASSRTSWTQ